MILHGFAKARLRDEQLFKVCRDQIWKNLNANEEHDVHWQPYNAIELCMLTDGLLQVGYLDAQLATKIEKTVEKMR